MSPNTPDESLIELMKQAQSGDEAALGTILDHHREQLKRLADKELGEKFSARVDASDVVQQTFLSVCRNLENFSGESPQEFMAWIYQIHKHNLQDVVRQHAVAEKQNLNKEQKLNEDEASDHKEHSTPSQKAMRLEDNDRLSELMARLPTDQSEALRLRYLEGKTLLEISNHFDRSTQSVASLLKRGLENLRAYSSSE